MTTRTARAAIVLPAAFLLASCKDRSTDLGSLEARCNGAVVCRYGIFELSIKHAAITRDPFFDPVLEAEFRSPDGRSRRVRGFYYGRQIWMVRFRPDTPGTWTYRYLFGRKGNRRSGVGRFACTQAEDRFVPLRVNPENPYRWITVSGVPYFPVGLQDCFQNNGSHIGNPCIDGERRSNPPPSIGISQYFSIYGQVGFNLLRFSQRNCSYPLYSDLGHYLENESLATDELLATARLYGFRVMFGIFGYHALWYTGNYPGKVLHFVRSKLGMLEEGTGGSGGPLEREKRFIDYCLARWGVYVDFWELLNERQAADSWTATMAAYTRAADPEHRLVTTSWEKPLLPDIGINAPHWYTSEKETESDTVTAQHAREWKRFRKPVIVGEHGNLGMNWDPKSALRMRIRLWTALFQEIAFVFWNTSWSKFGMNGGVYTPANASNIYLGPEERNYIRVLSDFSSHLDSAVRQIPIGVSVPERVRAYGLGSNSVIALFLHHYADHGSIECSTEVSFTAPAGIRRGKACWIDPATGRQIGIANIRPGNQTLRVPSFQIDIALLLASPQL
jgi:Domain of unknown function (DUF5060)